MKQTMIKLTRLIIYFFTPEDSTGPVKYGFLSADIQGISMGPETAKALFWMITAFILFFVLAML